MTNPRPRNPAEAITTLTELRRDAESFLSRIDFALSSLGHHDRHPRRPVPRKNQLPTAQTYPEGYDFRNDPEGLRKAIETLRDRVMRIDSDFDEFNDDQFFGELRLRTAEARILQSQCEENSSEWETTVGAIRTMTRIVSEEKPGYVFGLSASHNTDWGKLILKVLEDYIPVP